MDETDLNRRVFLLSACASAATGGAAAQSPVRLTVYKSPSCGCCTGWVTHARRAGYAVQVVDVADLTPVKARLGVPAALASCHTTQAGRHVFEGHVPLVDLRAFLARPRGLGLAVPGMPVGSPGMESPDGSRERFDVIVFDQRGRTRVFARHG